MPKINVIAERCPSDHPCPVIPVCPVGAIKQDGVSAPTIDQSRCISCGRCTFFCAYGAISMD